MVVGLTTVSSNAVAACTRADMMVESERKARPTASFGQSMKAVFWSFFGVRKGRDLEHDVAALNPLHIVLAAVICAAIFIALLITVVHVVTR
jgi:hypothetical protein